MKLNEIARSLKLLNGVRASGCSIAGMAGKWEMKDIPADQVCDRYPANWMEEGMGWDGSPCKQGGLSEISTGRGNGKGLS